MVPDCEPLSPLEKTDPAPSNDNRVKASAMKERYIFKKIVLDSLELCNLYAQIHVRVC